MAGTTLAAVVRIVDLPIGTTITGVELLEVIQTASGVGQSIQVPVSQLVTSTFGTLPTGGGTSQILAKSSGSNFSTAWYDLTTFVSVNATTLATTGSGTALVIGIAAGGVGSTQLAANAVQRTNITAFAIGSGQIDTSGVIRVNLTAAAVGSAQIDAGGVVRANLTAFAIGSGQIDTSAVQRANLTAFAIGSGQIDTAAISSTQIANNSIGTNQLASSLGIASSLSIGTLLTVGGTVTVTGTTILNGGLQVTGTTLVTGTFGQVGTSLMTGLFGVSGTAIHTGSFNVVGTATFTSGAFGVSGTTLFTSGAFGVVGTATFTSTLGIVGTSLQTGFMNVVGTASITGTLIFGNFTTGFLQASSTGVISAAPGSGNFVLLNTLSPNNVASTNDTTSFSATYKNYMITFENVCPATQTTSFSMQVATSGSAWASSSYISQFSVDNQGINTFDYSTTALLLSATRATTSVQTSLAYGVAGFIKIFNPSGTIAHKQIVGSISYLCSNGAVSTSTAASGQPNGWYDGSVSPVTGINFLFSAGNIQTGTIKIYGIS